VRRFLGNLQQLGGLTRYQLTEGKAKGVDCVDVDAGDLRFTVLVDRGLDIHKLSYKGVNLSYLSPGGVVAPAYCEPDGYGWLRGFPGGFLCTCGPVQVGDPCAFEGVNHGLHGRASATPAERVCVAGEWIDGMYLMSVSGTVAQRSTLGENIAIHRRIETALGSGEVLLTDIVVNEGGVKCPFMLLYHINFGYPFLSPSTKIELDTRKVTGFDARAESRVEGWNRMDEPAYEAPEEVFFHDAVPDADGLVRMRLSGAGIRATIAYDPRALPTLAQWKFPRAHDYAMAFEPCNNHVRGLQYEHDNGTLSWLSPGESQTIVTHFQFQTIQRFGDNVDGTPESKRREST